MDKARIEKWIEDTQREAIRVCEGGAARRCIPRQDTDTDALLGDGARMMVAALAHIDALEAVLAALTTPDASGYIGYDPNFPERHFCTYCGESWGVGSDEWHTADCVFARARALLE